MGEVIYKLLDVRTWPDLVTLFGKNGACGGCWCMTWRLTSKEYEATKGENNKLKFYDLVKAGKPLGTLAFSNNMPIGWCSVSPRETFLRLEKSRLFKRFDSIHVWSVTCLFIRIDYRRNGLSSALIKAACNNAFKQGAITIEAYPIISKKDKMPDVFAWVGFTKAYKNAGFEVIGQPSETRLIMLISKEKIKINQ